MKNILTIENGTAILLSNVDDGTNTIFINGAEIPASSWVGSGVYQFTESGVTFTIQKTNANTGNIMLQLVQGTAYRLVKQFKGEPYNSGDPLATDLANDDYVPFYDTSAGAKKNSLWSNIVAKIKTALGIASSGTTFLRKDGTWATPTNTTYTFATGDSNGQIKVTPSGGTAQNVSVKGLGTAAYTASTAYAVNKMLTNEDLDNVRTPGFYNAGGGNTCTNTGLASGVAFGLEVIHLAAGHYYMQRLVVNGNAYIRKRICVEGTWGAWTNEVLNNLTSDSTTEALSAAQGKALNTNKAAKSEAVKTISRSGTTFTATRADGTTFTFTQQDNNTTYTASRGIGITSGNAIYIKGWTTFTATALNASGNVTFRFIQNFCWAYQTYFKVAREVAVSAQLVTIDSSEYYYAPLFSLTADQATTLVGSNLPTTNGEQILFGRHENARQMGSSVWRLFRKTASVYFILDETLRVTKASGTTGLNNLVGANIWDYTHVGVLFFMYN